jgi:hypothetical protein
MNTPFNIGDTIEFTRVNKQKEFELVTGEVVELPASQRHLPHLVCVKLDGGGYKMFKRADMIAPLVLILG